MDEATLDEFGSEDNDGVETTLAWAPEGAACAACGAVVECRWRRDPGLVCVDCLDWATDEE